MTPGMSIHIGGLVAGLRRLVLDCRETIGSDSETVRYPNSSGQILSAIECIIGLLDVPISDPLMMVRGASGVGKTVLLNSICERPFGKPSWKRPSSEGVVIRLGDHLRGLPVIRSLMVGASILEEPPDPIFAAVVDTPDVDLVDDTTRSLVLGWSEIVDLILWISSPQRFHEEAGRWRMVGSGAPDRPVAFALGHADECVDGESESILHAWRMELTGAGFDDPVMFALPGDLSKIRDWMGLELSRDVIIRIRLARLASLCQRLAGKLEGCLEERLRIDLPEIRDEWRSEIKVEADHLAEMVMEGLDTRRSEMEAFLEADLHDRLKGIMAFWLKYVSKVRSGNGLLTGGWRAIVGQFAWGNRDPSTRRDQASRLALEPAIDGIQADKRREDLVVRLRSILVSHGFTLESGERMFTPSGNSPWRDQLLAQARTVLEEFENKRLSSGGIRGLVREAVIWTANYFPPLCLVASISWPVILFFDPMGWNRTPQWIDFFLPAACLVLVLLGIQALLGMVMPFQWTAIRAELKQRLSTAKAKEIERDYFGLLESGAAQLGRVSSTVRTIVGRARELAKSAMDAAGECDLVPRLFQGCLKR